MRSLAVIRRRHSRDMRQPWPKCHGVYYHDLSHRKLYHAFQRALKNYINFPLSKTLYFIFAMTQNRGYQAPRCDTEDSSTASTTILTPSSVSTTNPTYSQQHNVTPTPPAQTQVSSPSYFPSVETDGMACITHSDLANANLSRIIA
jgi:hypothetical protein